jgi:hypothetical protein
VTQDQSMVWRLDGWIVSPSAMLAHTNTGSHSDCEGLIPATRTATTRRIIPTELDKTGNSGFRQSRTP